MSGGGGNTVWLVFYSETGCNSFSLSCIEVRREISESQININNSISPDCKLDPRFTCESEHYLSAVKHLLPAKWLICER